jgi:osmotically-inducible protein OsmY
MSPKYKARARQIPALTRFRLFTRGIAVGAVAAHLLDPDRGHARRARLRDRIAAGRRHLVRSMERATWGRVHRARDHVTGVVRHGVHTLTRESPDDATLAQKVRSEVLGPRFHVHGVSVDAAAGVVHLRGEIPSRSLIDELTSATRKVYGVVRVDSYLHLPGEPAPNKRLALAALNSD